METETVKTVKHTPLPWSYKRTHQLSSDTWYVLIDPNARGPIMDVGGKDVHGQIAEAKYLVTDPEEIEANAEFIVRACNSHYELLEGLQWALGNLNQYDKPSTEDIEKYNKAVEAIKKATS